MSEYFDLKDDYQNAIILDEYNGEFSLVMGQVGKDGEAYKRWGKLQIGKKDDEKFTKIMPWKVKLGDKQRAADILYWALETLGVEAKTRQPGEEDGLPF